MENVRFVNVWWYFTDDGDNINCFIFNKKTTRIKDLITDEIHEIDSGNIFKSIKNIYGTKGRIDNTITVLSDYFYTTGTNSYKQASIYATVYKYVDANYLKNFTEKFREKIHLKQTEIIYSIKNNESYDF